MTTISSKPVSEGKTTETISEPPASLTLGENGPILLNDTDLLEHLNQLIYSNTLDRIAYNKGFGAYGKFEVTKKDFAQYCKSSLFQNLGKQCRIVVRFSRLRAEKGSLDLSRDVYGMAIRFYTKEGNWDLIGNNFPVFFINDPILFPGLMKSLHRSKETGLYDDNQFWNFIATYPETLHLLTMLYTERGLPNGVRHMNAFSVNTFVLLNKENVPSYVRFHILTEEQIQNLSNQQATYLNHKCPDYAHVDLRHAIANGEYPQWTLCAQIMGVQEAIDCPFNPFDATKVWSHGTNPLIEIGKLTLNELPKNIDEEIENLAFSPGNLIDGIMPCALDRLLQGRLATYTPAQYHRLGTKFQDIPVNQSEGKSQKSEEISSGHVVGTIPIDLLGRYIDDQKRELLLMKYGKLAKEKGDEDDYYTQVRIFWNDSLSEASRKVLCENIAADLAKVSKDIQEKMLNHFTQIDSSFGELASQFINEYVSESTGKLPRASEAEPLAEPRESLKA